MRNKNRRRAGRSTRSIRAWLSCRGDGAVTMECRCDAWGPLGVQGAVWYETVSRQCRGPHHMCLQRPRLELRWKTAPPAEEPIVRGSHLGRRDAHARGNSCTDWLDGPLEIAIRLGAFLPGDPADRSIWDLLHMTSDGYFGDTSRQQSRQQVGRRELRHDERTGSTANYQLESPTSLGGRCFRGRACTDVLLVGGMR